MADRPGMRLEIGDITGPVEIPLDWAEAPENERYWYEDYLPAGILPTKQNWADTKTVVASKARGDALRVMPWNVIYNQTSGMDPKEAVATIKKAWERSKGNIDIGKLGESPDVVDRVTAAVAVLRATGQLDEKGWGKQILDYLEMKGSPESQILSRSRTKAQEQSGGELGRFAAGAEGASGAVGFLAKALEKTGLKGVGKWLAVAGGVVATGAGFGLGGYAVDQGLEALTARGPKGQPGQKPRTDKELAFETRKLQADAVGDSLKAAKDIAAAGASSLKNKKVLAYWQARMALSQDPNQEAVNQLSAELAASKIQQYTHNRRMETLQQTEGLGDPSLDTIYKQAFDNGMGRPVYAVPPGTTTPTEQQVIAAAIANGGVSVGGGE